MGELDNKRTFPQRFVSSMVVVVSRTSHYLSHGGGGILGGIGAEGDQSSPMRTVEMNHKNIVLQSFMGDQVKFYRYTSEVLRTHRTPPPSQAFFIKEKSKHHNEPLIIYCKNKLNA